MEINPSAPHCHMSCELGNMEVWNQFRSWIPAAPLVEPSEKGRTDGGSRGSHSWRTAKQTSWVQRARQQTLLPVRRNNTRQQLGNQHRAPAGAMLAFLFSRFSINSSPFVGTQQCSDPATRKPALDEVFPLSWEGEECARWEAVLQRSELLLTLYCPKVYLICSL